MRPSGVPFPLALLVVVCAVWAEESTLSGPAQLPARLSLRECILITLKANKDVQVSELGVRAGSERITEAKGQFDVNLSAELSRGHYTTPVAGVPLGEDNYSTGWAEVSLTKRIVTGTDVGLTLSTLYSRDHDDMADLNPTHSPTATLTVSQDLLKDRGPSINRTHILVASNNLKVSREALRQTLIEQLLEVQKAYWELYFARANLKVIRNQLERAQKLVDLARAQQEVGLSAPIDVARAQSSAAAQEAAILQAQDRIQQVRHRLLRVMGVIDRARVSQPIEPADEPPSDPRRFTLDECLQVAFKSRPDYLQSELALRNAVLYERYWRNQRLPDLEVFGEYSLFGMGTTFSRSVDVLERGHYDRWTVGLRFSWPIPNRAGRSRYHISRIERRQAELQLEAVKERIVREVADALSAVRTAIGRIEKTREARQLAEQLLRAEERSFSLGRSTSIDVLLAQGSLAQAERDEARARADYAIALAALYAARGDLLQHCGVVLAEDARPRLKPAEPQEPSGGQDDAR